MDPIILEVQYECLNSLKEDLEWRVNYVGSAESEGYDQILDSALVGPVQPGHFKFRMEAPAPDPNSKLLRNIMADHPRVTKFPHDFDNEPAPMPEPDAEPEPELEDDVLLDDDGADEGDEEDEEDGPA
eukprot:gene10468-10626_t